MKVGSLFSGIGGLDLGLERAGMKVIWQCEIDEYASKVLKKHWPGVPNLGDITKVDWNAVERPDLLCGGFPCQDISIAGKGRGLEGEKSGLWWDFHKAISVLRPRYVLVENVPMLTHRGLDAVLASLSEIGYDAEWNIVSARFVGANHRRDRIFIVAYPHSERCERSGLREEVSGWRSEIVTCTKPGSGSERRETVFATTEGEDVANPRRLCRGDHVGGSEGEMDNGRKDETFRPTDADSIGGSGEGPPNVAHPQSILSGHGDNGNVSIFWNGQEEWERGSALRSREWWAVEPDVGRMAPRISNRMDRLRCLGNAVVPQVGEFVGRAIVEYERRWKN